MSQTQIPLSELLGAVAKDAERAAAFDSVRVTPSRVECAAKGSTEPAFYRVDADRGRIYVSLVMKDRWLSESIEADLVHTGDSLGELIEEEWVDLGGAPGKIVCEHFRSDDKMFTFRTPVGPDTSIGPADAERTSRMLLAYEACFRRLGDMGGDEATA